MEQIGISQRNAGLGCAQLGDQSGHVWRRMAGFCRLQMVLGQPGFVLAQCCLRLGAASLGRLQLGLQIGHSRSFLSL